MSDTINNAVIKVKVDGSEAKAGIEDVKRSINSLGAATKDATNKSTASIANYVRKLELAAANVGKTTSEIKLMELAQRGASEEQLKAAEAALRTLDLQKQAAREAREAARAPVASIADNTAAATAGNARAQTAKATSNFNPFGGLGVASKQADDLNKKIDTLGKTTKLTAYQSQQLSFQLNDLFVQVASGQSPLTALIQQGSQLNGTFGGTKGTLAALATVFTPLRLAIGGVVGALGTLAYAYAEGAKQSKEFAAAILLSGNYAGQTEGKINSLAKNVAASTNSSILSVREYANELIKTGQIGPQVFSAATEAAVAYGNATGKTAQEVAADFAKMAQGPTKFAAEIDKSMNLFTSAERDAIKEMEENGRAADAQALIYEKLTARLKGLDSNLGFIEKTLKTGKNAWASFWDSALAIGRNETIEDRIGKLNRLATAGQAGLASGGRAGLGMTAEQSREFVSRDGKAELKGLQRRALRESENADAEAMAKADAKEADAGKKVVDGLLKKGKAASEYKTRLAELNRSIDANKRAGTPYSKADEATARKELKKEFTDTAGASEGKQVLKANLDSDLKAIKDALDAEKETLAFHQKYVQGVYTAGQISLKDFYDEKRATIEAGVTAEVAELDKEIARLQQYKKATTDPSEKIVTQTKINEAGAQKEKLKTAAGREVVLANQEEAASFRALQNQVSEYNAALLQMQGDELGAAQIRAQIAIANAKILATQGAKDVQGNLVKIDVDGYAKSLNIANQFADVQRKAGDLAANTSRAEEAANLRAEQSGKSLVETERDIYNVRSKAVDQLAILAARAKELADASTDPKIKSFAADLALQYAKAADAVDPALNRLRDAQKELAAGITGTLNSGIANFSKSYADQRKAANDEVKTERDKYDRKIDILEGYLATTRDKNDRARLLEKIKAAQADRDGVKKESKGSSILKTINASIIQPMATQALATVNKLLVTDPLQKYLEAQFRGLTEGDGMLAGFFKDALKIQDPKALAQTAEIASINASASALDVLANAATNAAGAIGGNRSLAVSADGKPAIPSMGDFTRAGRAMGDGSTDPAAAQATADARQAVEGFGSSATSAASDVAKLAAAAGKGGSALGLLPSIINTISAVMSSLAASSTASSSGSSLGALASIFGKTGASASGASDVVTSYYFHTGGIVGSTARAGAVSSSIFANAPRYHTGGLAGTKADTLKHGEVPAILMKNEEVLRADDPRHRGNLGTELFKQIMAGAKPWNQTVADKAKDDKPQGESLSGLLRTIGAGKGDGENSASVLGSLLSRLGVKDSDALKVSGARALGGPVSAGGLYRVNEKRPELLEVAGKQYLMTGSQGGKIDPNPQMGGGGHTTNLHINVTPPAGSNAATAAQWGATAGRQIQRATARNN